MSPHEVQTLCKRYGVLPSKARGQNFVVDANVIRRMIDHANLDANDCVVEIGPGFGALTMELAERVRKVVAVEVDKKLVEALRGRFAEAVGGAPFGARSVMGVGKASNAPSSLWSSARFNPRLKEPTQAGLRVSSGGVSRPLPVTRGSVEDVEIVYGDILKIKNEELIKIGVKGYKVVANLPYSITSAVLRKFTEYEPRPSLIVVMVQKEVAERVCAKPGEMSVLSVAIQYYGQPEIMAIVPRTAFWPEPEVESAILKITITPSLSPPYLKGEKVGVDEKRLFQIVRMGFSSRRKQLVNNLMAGLRQGRPEVAGVLEKVGIAPQIRAQELTVYDWIALSRVL